MNHTKLAVLMTAPLVYFTAALHAHADLDLIYAQINGKSTAQKVALRAASTVLGQGMVKTAYRLPNAYDDGGVVLKVCTDANDDCIPTEIADYDTIAADFENELVDYYPNNADDVDLFLCPGTAHEECQYMLESYIGNQFKSIGNDFGGNQNVTANCQWAAGQNENDFVHALNNAMGVPFANHGYGPLINPANATSVGAISATLTTTDYIFSDLQGGFTGQTGGPGFVISDTGVEDNYTVGERNCQVNWLCNLANRLGGHDVCDYIQNLP